MILPLAAAVVALAIVFAAAWAINVRVARLLEEPGDADDHG